MKHRKRAIEVARRRLETAIEKGWEFVVVTRVETHRRSQYTNDGASYVAGTESAQATTDLLHDAKILSGWNQITRSR